MRKFNPLIENYGFVYELNSGEEFYTLSLETNKTKAVGFASLKKWFDLQTSENDVVIQMGDQSNTRLITRHLLTIPLKASGQTYSGNFIMEVIVRNYKIDLTFIIAKLKREKEPFAPFDLSYISYIEEDMRGGLYPAERLLYDLGLYFNGIAMDIKEYIKNSSNANVIEIRTLIDLRKLSEEKKYWKQGYHFLQMADIDASETIQWNDGAGFCPIGDNDTDFEADYDGGGYTISGININRKKKNGVGIFGCINKSNITNVKLTNAYIWGNCWVGAVVGANTLGNINNCSSSGLVLGTASVGGLIGENGGSLKNCFSTTKAVANEQSAGGLVGHNNKGLIELCKANSEVVSTTYAGGLVGYNSGKIFNCSAKGEVFGRIRSGGLIGMNSSSGTISNCYAIGNTFGETCIGGLCGMNYGTINYCYSKGYTEARKDCAGGFVGELTRGQISNCYSTGLVFAAMLAGGFVGTIKEGNLGKCFATGSVEADKFAGCLVGHHASFGSIENCYATGYVKGSYESGGLVAISDNKGQIYHSFWNVETSGMFNSASGEAKTTSEMKNINTYLPDWDFDAIWEMTSGNYPMLKNMP